MSQKPTMCQLQNQMRELQAQIRDDLVLQSDRKVFVSYSSKDHSLAEKVCAGLQYWGHGIWIDRIEMEDRRPPAPQIEARLYEGITAANCLLLLLSRKSVKSEWVKKEYSEAIRQQKQGRDLMLLLGVLDKCAIPSELAEVKQIDFRREIDSVILDVVVNLGIRVQKRRDEPAASDRPQHRNLGTTSSISAALAYNEGNFRYQKGDLDAAIKKWNVALKLDPEFSDALYNSACALYELAIAQKKRTAKDRLLRQAIERYESVLNKGIQDVDAMVNLAAAYRTCESIENPKREFELLTTARSLAPKYGLVHLNAGHFFAKYGGWREIGARLDEIYEKGEATVSINIDFLQKALQAYTIASKCNEKLTDQCQAMSEGVQNLINLCKSAAGRQRQN